MSRTVTALYDTRAEAEAARERLQSQVDVEGRAQIIDKSSLDNEEGSSGFQRVPLSSEDRQAYGEGLNRGGFMLCAEVDGDEDADEIVSILEQTSSVDLDERQSAWRNEGWAGGETSSGTSANVVEEQRIPVVEEQLRVGKREEQRGGARVRSYVEERPVHETVSLREEHVNVERRAVDEPVATQDLNSDLLRDRTVEMRATSEEAVVAKEARVTEEVVIQKTASEHSEEIDDTVRSTRVEVDENGGTPDRSAF